MAGRAFTGFHRCHRVCFSQLGLSFTRRTRIGAWSYVVTVALSGHGHEYQALEAETFDDFVRKRLVCNERLRRLKALRVLEELPLGEQQFCRNHRLRKLMKTPAEIML